VLTSGGSVATLVGLAVMRHVKSRGWKAVSTNGNRVDGAAKRETADKTESAANGATDRTAGVRQDAAPLVVYTSTQGHSCIQKAVELLGLGSDHLRRIATDAEHRFDLDALRRQIAADRAAGLTPACVVASAGTVNTGTIDPLDAIADLCEAEGLWMHVDGAYGAVARLTDTGNTLFRGLERADSLGLDAHKWLYMPVECGCAFVRDRQAMRDTFSVVPPYLRDDTAWPWFSEFTIQQTRGFRALKLWMVIQQVGLDGYRAAIARDIALARTLQDKLRARRDFQIVAAGPLSIVCFRYAPAGVGDEATDALTRGLLDIVQREGRAFLTSTELDGRPVLRACIVNFRTTEADLDVLLDTIADAGQRTLAAAAAVPPHDPRA
jgi:glutamate/tyrosine decarboxylase-like PLP-dependent enzyme